MSRPDACADQLPSSGWRRLMMAAWLIGLLVPAWIATARAQEVALLGYEAVIAEALDRYAARDWAAARAAFEAAHALRPGGRTLRGVGLSAYYAGDYVAAAVAFQQALDEARHALSPEHRAQVRDLLAKTLAQVAELRVTATPLNAIVRVADQTVSHGERMLLAPGRYSLEVSGAGYQPSVQQVDLAASQKHSLHVELVPEPPAPAVISLPPTPPVDTASPASSASPSPQRSDTASRPASGEHTEIWIAAGATLAAAASAAIFVRLADNELESLRQSCHEKECDSALRGELWRESPIDTYETLANVSLVTAAAGLAATAAFLLIDAAEGQPRDAAKLRMRPSYAGSSLQVAF